MPIPAPANAQAATASAGGTAGRSTTHIAPRPMAIRHSPGRTRRRGPHRAMQRACTHDPAVQVRVDAVRASAASVVGACRTVTIAYGTYASPAKKQHVSSDRLRIVTASPGRAERYRGGVRRRIETASRAPPAIPPAATTGTTPELSDASAVPAPATTPSTARYGTLAVPGLAGGGTWRKASTTSTPAATTSGSKPRNTQRQPTAVATRAAIPGPIRPGTTHAVESTANILGRDSSA